MNRPVAILSSLAVLSIFSACKPPEAAQKSTTNSTTTTVGTVDDSAGFWVKPCKKFEESEGKGTCTAGNYLLHKQTGIMSNPATDAAANYNQECKVNASDVGTANALISCTVEADELELVFNGLAFAYNVPSTMCEYFGLDPFYFWNFKPSSSSTSTGPTAVSYTLDTNGKIQGSITSTPSGDAVANADNTGVRCKYDYSTSDPAGPNCCEGTYTLTVTQLVDSAPSVVTTTTPKWSGRVSNCLAGPAMITQPKTYNGFPLRSYYYVAGQGISSGYKAYGPTEDSEPHSSYLVANHFNSFTPSLAETGYPSGFKTWAKHTPQPFYDFVCLDRDDEVLARIRVTVREWNTLAELNKYRLGAASANPDATGNDSSGDANDDWSDWNNVDALATPFPQSTAIMNLGGGALMSKMTPELY